MIPDPFHPLVVHFPIVFAVLTPLAVIATVALMATGRAPAKAWIAVVVLQLMLVASGWLALETGEHEEEAVEAVIAERFIEDHEESAERFMLLATLGLPIAAFGLMGGGIGTFARASMLLASVATLAIAGLAGHSGGQLVYQHGAALAYMDQQGTSGEMVALELRGRNFGHDEYEEHDDDDDD